MQGRRSVSCATVVRGGILSLVADIRAGQRFGQWITTGASRIGGGGNGEVWAVSGDDGRSGAIKILRVRRGAEGLYRLGRFSDEIGFLLAHPEFPASFPCSTVTCPMTLQRVRGT